MRSRNGRATALALAFSSILLPPQVAAQAPPVDCAAVAAERAQIAAQLQVLRQEIADIALGKAPRRKVRVSGGDAARGAAGAAAGLLLPFPLGLLAGAGAAATKDRKPKADPPGPDVPAMIERQQALEARLAELSAAGCG
ncbi:hypothetical protein E2493_12210 [Sphingomonas parva]|uniref:Uncharacterized protein n=1 Tax=Sphingomonas parva TaxID=2555898 RepID=A0A4Y8ZPR7_9SPHN|nr:hypothetical protein [Sphingomonas parva]TFI57954.1 hypothetical protein E2493_12210 [Sphingomonas parva]